MSMPAPLLDLLSELQRRNFPLGVSDYLLALKALAGDAHINSRDDLIFLCSVLWGKSREEQREVAEVLDSLLPARFTHQNLMDFHARSEAAEAGPPPAPSAAPAQQGQPATPPAQSKEPTTETPAKPKPAAGGQGTTKVPSRAVGATPPAPGDAVPPAEKTWEINPKLDLIGSLPVTRRQMKRGWRYFRRMKRVGPPVELDVQATVEQMYRQGVFLEPVLIPRRLNLSRLLVLADEGGSMVPFRRVVEPLLESAMQSGLAKVAVYYFHDAISNRVFEDSLFSKPVPLEEALKPFGGAGVLIISDGGAARGNYDPHRIEQTRGFIGLIKSVTLNMAWLNPTPPSRWAGTTAEAIVKESAIYMSPLDRAGLYAAVDVIRGRAR